ncbi:phage head morphogenesis protein [Aeromonas piscicola]|uniref:phage head morphogenesis protein n=1 Tax=Aeromonas piscicola TaxID=600645 RepID=UPI0006948CFF|nr:phage head morphogenesis protein [Aeromonas piscicola]
MANIFNIGLLLRMEPKEVVDYFQAKGHTISWDWQETLHSAHARGFTVAKATSLEVLTTLQSSVGQAVATGMTMREFSNQLMPELKRLGWWGQTTVTHENGQQQTVTLGSPRRLETIYRTNMTTAYQAGRYLQQMNQPEHPYWQYIAVMDKSTRSSHAAMNGLVFAATDPIWETHYPPNDWGCRCRVRAMSKQRLEANGLSVSSSEGDLSTTTVEMGESLVTGEVYQSDVTRFSTVRNGKRVSMAPSAGWSYNVGSAAFGTDAAVANKLIEMQDRPLRQAMTQSLNNAPVRLAAYRDWVGAALDGRATQGVMPVAFLSDALVQQAGSSSMGRVAVLSQRAVKSTPLDQSDYEALPSLLAAPRAMLRDEHNGDLLLLGDNRLMATLATSEPNEQAVRTGLARYHGDTLAQDMAAGRYVLIQGELPGGE